MVRHTCLGRRMSLTMYSLHVASASEALASRPTRPCTHADGRWISKSAMQRRDSRVYVCVVSVDGPVCRRSPW